jgi:hypothetical protein
MHKSSLFRKFLLLEKISSVRGWCCVFVSSRAELFNMHKKRAIFFGCPVFRRGRRRRKQAPLVIMANLRQRPRIVQSVERKNA